MLRRILSRVATASKRRAGLVTVFAIVAAFAIVVVVGGFVVMCGCGGNDGTIAQEQQTRERLAGGTAPIDQMNKDKDADMSNQAKNAGPMFFYEALDKALTERGTTTAAVCDKSDPVSRRVLEDYGAMFLANKHVTPPPVCVFKAEDEVILFQNNAKSTAVKFGGSTIELQPAAMQALLEAREEAIKDGLNITPRGGAEAARRSYGDTRRLWDTRFLPALVHWQRKGRLSKTEVAELRGMPLNQQVGRVLELEKKGIFFSKDLSKSILYSIAAPGTSQHIAMLALDVTQFSDARVRRILARHGWFQTVKSDLPHFTYLGVAEVELPSLGLHAVMSGDQKFWIPNINSKETPQQ